MKVSIEDFKKYLTINRGLAPKSISTYLIRFKKIDERLTSKNQELSKAFVSDFLYELKEVKKLSNPAINTYIQTLKHIEGCYQFHDIEIKFMTGINNLPKVRTNKIPLSKEEVFKLLKTKLSYMNRNGVDCSDLDNKFLTLTEFLVYTGARFDEAASLKIGELDIDNGRATLLNTKNKDNRFVFFKGPIKEHLRKLTEGKSPDELVFSNSKGGHMHDGDFNNNLRLRAKKAGITKHVHAHLLRHTNATLLYNSTKDITLVAKVLGHHDVQTTYDTYVHLDTEEIQRGTDKNPLLSKFISPDEILENVQLAIAKFKLNEDKRFLFHMDIDNGELQINVKIKN